MPLLQAFSSAEVVVNMAILPPQFTERNEWKYKLETQCGTVKVLIKKNTWILVGPWHDIQKAHHLLILWYIQHQQIHGSPTVVQPREERHGQESADMGIHEHSVDGINTNLRQIKGSDIRNKVSTITGMKTSMPHPREEQKSARGPSEHREKQKSVTDPSEHDPSEHRDSRPNQAINRAESTTRSQSEVKTSTFGGMERTAVAKRENLKESGISDHQRDESKEAVVDQYVDTKMEESNESASNTMTKTFNEIISLELEKDKKMDEEMQMEEIKREFAGVEIISTKKDHFGHAGSSSDGVRESSHLLGPSPMKHSPVERDAQHSYTPPIERPPNDPTDSLYSTSLMNGTTIHVYVTDITKLEVGAIVNAANELLEHAGGVAWAIAKAAGHDFQTESRKIIQHNGPIPLCHVAEQSAGKNLPCMHVIHAVGPVWSAFPDKELCRTALMETFNNAFRSADSKCKVRSVATPAISSGWYMLTYSVTYD